MASTEFHLILSTRTGSEYSLAMRGELRFGRDPANDVVIDQPEVAPVHLLLRERDGRLFAEDLGSERGTWLGDHRLTSPREFEPGASLRIGDVTVRRAGPSQPWELTDPAGGVRIPLRRAAGEATARSLAVRLEPPEAVLRDPTAGVEHTVSAPNRVAMLYFLACARLDDLASGVHDARCGWRSDESAALAVWGRSGLDSSRNRLNTLTYRVRLELASVGLPEDLLQKRAGWVRLGDIEVRVGAA